MSDVPNPAPAAPVVPAVPAAPAAPAPAAPAPVAPAVPADNAPKWDGPFDAERAARLVENLRSEVAGLKAQNADAQAKLTEHAQAQMSDLEKATARATAAETELAKARRDLAVSAAIQKHGLSDADKEWLTGDTAEEIDARAAKLAARGGAVTPTIEAPTLPPTLPVPGNGADPAAVGEIAPTALAGMSHKEIMAAYRDGRIQGVRK